MTGFGQVLYLLPSPKAKQEACKALVALLKAIDSWHPDIRHNFLSKASTAGPCVRNSPLRQDKTKLSSSSVIDCRP